MMSKLITLAVFDNSFDVNYNLLKGMLDEAGIPYLTSNENFRSVKPLPFTTPTNISIEIKIYDDYLEEAKEILDSVINS